MEGKPRHQCIACSLRVFAEAIDQLRRGYGPAFRAHAAQAARFGRRGAPRDERGRFLPGG